MTKYVNDMQNMAAKTMRLRMNRSKAADHILMGGAASSESGRLKKRGVVAVVQQRSDHLGPRQHCRHKCSVQKIRNVLSTFLFTLLLLWFDVFLQSQQIDIGLAAAEGARE